MNCFIMVWSNGINVRLNQSCWLSEVFGFDRERQLGFVVDMKKRPSVKQKIPSALIALENLRCVLIFGNQSPSALHTVMKFEKKERKLFPIIKDVKTTFVKHSERNFCLYLPFQNFDKFMQTKTKHNETKQAQNKIPPSFNSIYAVSKVMAVENKIRNQGPKWYNQKPHFLQWWSDNYGRIYNITVINVIRVETFMTVY